jgi:hypothetical protein
MEILINLKRIIIRNFQIASTSRSQKERFHYYEECRHLKSFVEVWEIFDILGQQGILGIINHSKFKGVQAYD